MGLLQDVRGFARFRKRKNPQDKGRIEGGGNIEYWITPTNAKRPSNSQLEYHYRKNPLMFRAINLLAPAYLGHGFTLESDNDRAISICEEIINKRTFKPALIEGVSNTITYGDGAIEQVWSETIPEKFKPIMGCIPKYNDRGNIKYYLQKLSPYEPTRFEKEEILFTRFWRVGDNIRGLGIIEPLIPTLEIEIDMQKSIREATKKFATPPLHAKKMGPKVGKNELKDMREELKNFSRKSLFCTSERYTLEMLNVGKRFPNLDWQFEYILNKICAGTGIPKPILLCVGETTNRATLDALINYNQYEISLVQEKLGFQIEEQTFMPALEKNGIYDVPNIKWNSLAIRDEKEKAEILQMMINSCEKLIELQLMTTEEAGIFLERFK